MNEKTHSGAYLVMFGLSCGLCAHRYSQGGSGDASLHVCVSADRERVVSGQLRRGDRASGGSAVNARQLLLLHAALLQGRIPVALQGLLAQVASLHTHTHTHTRLTNEAATSAATTTVSVIAHTHRHTFTHMHTHTHPFNDPLSGTTQVSRYQKGKTYLDFTEARDSEWQWHQLGLVQVCTSLQTDNHASIPPLSF